MKNNLEVIEKIILMKLRASAVPLMDFWLWTKMCELGFNINLTVFTNYLNILIKKEFIKVENVKTETRNTRLLFITDKGKEMIKNEV